MSTGLEEEVSDAKNFIQSAFEAMDQRLQSQSEDTAMLLRIVELESRSIMESDSYDGIENIKSDFNDALQNYSK